MKEFDPFGWLEKFFPAYFLHRLIRIGIILILIVFLVYRLILYSRYLVKPLWVAETLIYVVFLISYAIRIDPIERSRGFKEIIIPLIGGFLPFALLLSPPGLLTAGNWLIAYIIFYWMTISTALTIWGLWTLRRSFSITVEVRGLIISGPYRWIRHPVYLGEILTALAVTFWRFSILNIVIFTLFVVIQLLRAKWEEAKLSRIFSAYSMYAPHVMWMWPYKKYHDIIF
jgi:protein-S-isoprenylcysteine O-methyltransferase Ste14